MYRLHIEQQVFVLHRREDEAEEAHADADALWVQVVVDIGGGVEEVTMGHQFVVLVVGLDHLRGDVGRVSLRERVAEVMHEVVDDVALR